MRYKKNNIFLSIENNTLKYQLSLAKKEFKKKVETGSKHWLYDSLEWKKTRYFILKRDGRVCALCRKTQGIMHVDHVIPVSIDRTKALDIHNLQVLCADCNIGKGNSDSVEWKYKSL